MLDELTVENLGIIERAHIEPGEGLVAFTGETGAGKTMLIGALRLLAGLAASSDLVGPWGDQTRVEGRLLFPDGRERVFARRISGGRSRAYLDGNMVPAATLEDLAGGVIELVAQHERNRLTTPAGARALLDLNLSSEGRELLGTYRGAWEALARLRADQERLGGDHRALERELDLVVHQANEIVTSGFRSGDDADLMTRAARLRHAEELTGRLGIARQSIAAASEAAGVALGELRRAVELDESLGPLVDQTGELLGAIAELQTEARVAAEGLEHDPLALEETERRLAQLGDLKRKYGDTLEAVLDFGKQAEVERQRLSELLASSDRLSGELDEALERVVELGDALRTARSEAGRRLAAAARRHLVDLGFTEPVLQWKVDPADPGPTGSDSVQLLFASDVRLEPAPVGKVGSGGELSRLVLAVRLAGGADRTPVVAFDEIDAGVGGRTALALGQKLAELSRHRQVLCVTHLPQVAAFADRHFVVERSHNTVTVRPVEGEGRLEELSRMLAGLPDSVRGKDHAEELVALAAGTGRSPAG